MKPSSTPLFAHSRIPARHFAGGLLIALTLTRWLLPTEATADGETLWIAGLWFLAGAMLCVWPRGLAAARRWDLADGGAVLLIGGHVLSGVIVLATAGDRRAAANLLWEWLSLGVFWFAWRAAIPIPQIRRAIVPVLIVTAVTLAVWGLWQYFFWYPQMKAEYLPLVDQFRQHQATGADTTEIVHRLSEAGIPTEEPSLTLFLNRLRDSQEPFGPFALANTFGGMLAAWLVIGISVMLRSVPFVAWRKDRSSAAPLHGSGAITMPFSRGSTWALAAGVILIGASLYLTKSRTAWGGAFAGVCAGGVLAISRRIRSGTIQHALLPLATLLAGLAGIAGLLLILQDVHAVPGPLKSLAYRAEYWRGTMALLKTSPVIGTGLGQFRDKYLAFKVPESSEEIADPHDLFLDVWANGGLVGLVGLGILLAVVWWRIWQLTGRQGAAFGRHPDTEPSRPVWRISGFLGFMLVTAGQLYSAGVWDTHVDHLLVFGVVWLLLSFVLPRNLSGSERDDSWLGLLAAVALSVHLLGAGGIAMPAVTQLWLLAIAWGVTPAEDAGPVEGQPAVRLVPLLAGGCCLVLFAGWYATAERPVHWVRHAIQQGDRMLSARHDPERAVRSYQAAAASDPWSPEPWMRLAHVEFSQALSARTRVDRQHLTPALAFAEAAIDRAPFRPSLYIQRADWLRDVARRSRHRSDWIAVRDAYRSALARHPSHAALLAKLAVCLSQSDEPAEAADMARRALAQDELNRARGHTERFLPLAVRQELQSILANRLDE